MTTYNFDQANKAEAITDITNRLKAKNKMFLIVSILSFAIFLCIFAINAVRCDVLWRLFLGTALQGLFPVIFGVIFIIVYQKQIKKPYKEMRDESITLYDDYIEHKYKIKHNHFTIKIPYKDITSTHITKLNEFVIITEKIEKRCKNTDTLKEKKDVLYGVNRHEILFCFENGEEMRETIKREVSRCFEQIN